MASFTYLGSAFTHSGEAAHEIDVRIGKAWAAFQKLKACLWNKRNISLRTKLKVYHASIRTILLYACETWHTKVADQRKLSAFEHRCLRTILKVRFSDHISNDAVRQRCHINQSIEDSIRERRLRWLGHIPRKPPGELTIETRLSSPLRGWKRRQGGQIKTWAKTILQDLEPFGGAALYGRKRWEKERPSLLEPIAIDRHQWRALIRDIMNSG